MSKNLAWDRFSHHHSCARYIGLFKYPKRAQLVFYEIYQMIWDIRTVLEPEASYTAQALCGPDLWAEYPSDGQHRAMGIAISAMVDMGFLPLVCVSPETVTNKRYGVVPEIREDE